MHPELDPTRLAMVDRVLAACGGGRFLHIGTHATAVVRAYRQRSVEAAALSIESIAGLRLPFDDRSFDVVCAFGVLDALNPEIRAAWFDEMLRVSSRAVLLYASGHLREQWETECLQRACRKHPLHQLLVPFDGLDWLTQPAVMLFEPLPEDVTLARSIVDLAATRDLHMDMLREGGRRADAHVGRYMLARQFIRPGDRVLDAACGMGYGSAILTDSTLAERVVGLDIDEWAIRYATDHYGRGRSRLSFAQRDLSTIGDWAPGSFDAVVSFETLEHIADPDAFLAACKRLLTPAGRLIGSVPNEWVDETGADPNPYHLHVFTRDTLVAMVRKHFLVERVFGQTAGGGMKLPDSGRALWTDDGQRDAEWWLVAGMTGPDAKTDAPFRHGLLDDATATQPEVVAFAERYDNPWLVRAMVTIGMRTESKELLDRFATATLATTGNSTADAGAALCVAAYRQLENGSASAAHLLDLIDRYCATPATVPHVRRWQISLRYVEGLLSLASGDTSRAMRALEACASADALDFSPLLATKTVGASLLRGWLAAQKKDAETARHWWTHGITQAERALHRPWSELVLNLVSPAVFGLREATTVVDLASRCATGLSLLPHLHERPGVVAAQLFESLTGRAERAEQHAQTLQATMAATADEVNVEIARLHEEIGNLRAEADRLRGEAAWARGEADWFKSRFRAQLLLEYHDVPVPSDLRFAIFGTGDAGRQAFAMLQSRGGVVDCFADNDRSRQGLTLDGLPIVEPSQLRARTIDVVAVTSVSGRQAIYAQLEQMGFEIGKDVASVG